MTDPQTDIEVIVDPNEPAPAPFRGVEVKGVAKYAVFISLGVLAVGLVIAFAAKTWTVFKIGGGLLTLAILAMLVVGAIERRR